MITKHEDMVHVKARPHADLVKLSGDNSPMELPCGGVGPQIAKKVLNGNGQALIPIHQIRMAIDTDDGVNAIFDKFVLTDPHSQYPLPFVLIRNLERSKKFRKNKTS